MLTPVTNLSAGERDLTLDLGVVAPTSVGNFAWIDANANGVQDGGETGLAGVTATLQTAAGVAVAQDIDGATIVPQMTGSDGLYLFSNLAPGQYRVVFTPPSGWLASPPAQGGDTAVDSTNPAVSAVLGPNEVDMTLDAGFWRPPASATSCGVTTTATVPRTAASPVWVPSTSPCRPLRVPRCSTPRTTRWAPPPRPGAGSTCSPTCGRAATGSCSATCLSGSARR